MTASSTPIAGFRASFVAAARKQPVEKRTLVPVTVVEKDNAASWEG